MNQLINQVFTNDYLKNELIKKSPKRWNLGRLFISIILFCFLTSGLSANTIEKEISSRLMWINTADAIPDCQMAFRGRFSIAQESVVNLQISGASWYVVWVDGKQFTEGPDRYAVQYPEYQRRKISLSKGEHLVAVQVHYEGVETRMQKVIQPFLYFQAFALKTEIPINWKCDYLRGYISNRRRIIPSLGWIEWADTRGMQKEWQQPNYSDTNWIKPVFVKRNLGEFSASKLSPVKMLSIKSDIIAKGQLAEVYGVFNDAPGATFYLRDLKCNIFPPEGIWYRFDLGQVMLSRPKFLVDVPPGTVIEFAYSEGLVNGRVSPWICVSGSDTYNIYRFLARGGVQEICPVTPLGGRFVELHIMAPESKVKLLDYSFIQRTYSEKEQGSFSCNDVLLNQIWQVGINTHRACSEDALTDNPTRERGQWIGDFGLVGLENATVAYTDIANLRRGFVQAAQAAIPEGMVVAQSPGNEIMIPSFSLQWVVSCMNYWRLTGDKSLLTELQVSAEKNMNAFDNYWTNDGIVCTYWNFIDWGYVPNSGVSDMALNMHYFMGLRAMGNWEKAVGQNEKALIYNTKADKVEKVIRTWLDKYKTPGGFNYDSIGYHRAVLVLRSGIISDTQKPQAIAAIKKHILNCFPNNPVAPRLSNPSITSTQLITPYFASYAFPVLYENDESQFVLNQYRKCWGWGINQGLTTWMEVFDLRWSHSHQWSGAPTWQLSRYVLGLHPSFDKKMNSFALDLKTGDIQHAKGKIPLPSGKMVEVIWNKSGEKIQYEVMTEEPIEISYKIGGKVRTLIVKDVLKIDF
jgi:hypothetical protein